MIYLSDWEAEPVQKNWAQNETGFTFKVTHWWSKIYWETNILSMSFLEMDRLVIFPIWN